jgi:hypothetical protein
VNVGILKLNVARRDDAEEFPAKRAGIYTASVSK